MEIFFQTYLLPLLNILKVILFICVPLLIGMAYLTLMERKVMGWMQRRARSKCGGSFRSVATVCRCAKINDQRDDYPLGCESNFIFNCADAYFFIGSVGLGGDTIS